MIALMAPFRTFSFLDFLADLLQKSISVASNLFACCVESEPKDLYSWIATQDNEFPCCIGYIVRTNHANSCFKHCYRFITDSGNWFIAKLAYTCVRTIRYLCA
jgi:hypothetical protein